MNEEFDTYDHEIITSTGQFENITTNFHGSLETAVETARYLQNLVRGGEGIPEAEYNSVLDRYLHEKKGIEENEWTKMNKFQQDVLQCIKRSVKRQNYKINKE